MMHVNISAVVAALAIGFAFGRSFRQQPMAPPISQSRADDLANAKEHFSWRDDCPDYRPLGLEQSQEYVRSISSMKSFNFSRPGMCSSAESSVCKKSLEMVSKGFMCAYIMSK